MFNLNNIPFIRSHVILTDKELNSYYGRDIILESIKQCSEAIIEKLYQKTSVTRMNNGDYYVELTVVVLTQEELKDLIKDVRESGFKDAARLNISSL